MAPLDVLSPAAPAPVQTRPTPAYSLTATPTATTQIGKIATGDQFLRVFVYEGGCSGLKVGFEIDTVARDGDVRFAGNLVSDEESMNYIDGAQVDFVDNLTSSRFMLVNPNATGGCGCGSSFKTN